MQYKMALSDEGSFQKDEWGPWLEQWVHHNDPTTGRVELIKVLRSDPAGVRLMKSYPDIGIDPGITPWADDTSWKREKVFADLARWEYTNLSNAEVQASRSKWASFAQWHTSHQSADTLVVGQPVIIGGRELHSPLLPWHQMWRVLKTNVTAAPDPTSSAPAPSTSQGADMRRVDRQDLSSSDAREATRGGLLYIPAHRTHGTATGAGAGGTTRCTGSDARRRYKTRAKRTRNRWTRDLSGGRLMLACVGLSNSYRPKTHTHMQRLCG